MSKSDGYFSLDSSKSFKVNAETFLQKTQEHVLQGINPGGIYQAIWCRDAAYILRDWQYSWNNAADLSRSADKESTSYNDIFDAFRLALKFYHFQERND